MIYDLDYNKCNIERLSWLIWNEIFAID